MEKNILLSPLKMGDIYLKNRICMAALTRMRTLPPNWVPSDICIKYHCQRASAGFMLTESVPISDKTMAFPGNGALYTKQQADGWKRVVDGVHEKSGVIVTQIWHGGRTAHSSLQGGTKIWGVSPIAIRGINPVAQKEQEIPLEMTKTEIEDIIGQFRKSAELAKEAGFDGVQLHGAHGYLIDQFLNSSSNQRNDDYGGSIQNRCRLGLQVIDEFIKVFGAGRVGIKLSPVGRYNDMFDPNPFELYRYLIRELDKRQIAFIELKDDDDKENVYNYGYPSSKSQIPDLFSAFRPLYRGVLLANNQFTPATASEGIKQGKFDGVTFGRLFISNPDLVERIQEGQSLNTNWDPTTFFQGGEKGYIDYPRFSEST